MLSHNPRNELIDAVIVNPTRVATVPMYKHALLPLALSLILLDLLPNDPRVRANIDSFLSESRPTNAVPIRPNADRADVMDP
jgi:hypothetical protein